MIRSYVVTFGFVDDNGAIDAFNALAQPTRLGAFRLLVTREPEGLPAGEIARLLNVPHNTMSTHLSVLARAGLIRSDRQSRSIIYRAELEQVRALRRLPAEGLLRRAPGNLRAPRR